MAQTSHDSTISLSEKLANNTNVDSYWAYSNDANATPTAPPAAPSSLTATAASNTQINLAWTDNSSNETGFKIKRKTPEGTYAEIATIGANVTIFSDTSLTASTVYFYRIRAFNTGGHSDYPNETSTTTLPNAPAVPSSLTATVAGSSQINLAWVDNSSNEDGFKIEHKIGAAGTYAKIATTGANVTSFVNTGLTDGVTYFYRVRAFNTQLVRTLVDGEISAGRHQLHWNGRNQFGKPIAAGVYLYQIVPQGQNSNSAFTQTRRMVLAEIRSNGLKLCMGSSLLGG